MAARSSAEVELRSTSHEICKALWLKMLLEELGVKLLSPMVIHCDNKAAISITHNPVHRDCTKHVEVTYISLRKK